MLPPAPAARAADPNGEGLPIDIGTVLIGIRRRIPLAVVVALAGAVVGVAAGYLFGNRVYQATTVLLYRPPQGASADSEGNEAPSLRTQVDLVKLHANLEETRRRLRLDAEITALGGAFEVEVPENTSLLTIQATWDDAETTAALANTLRDVFQENQRGISRTEAQSKMRDLEARLQRVVDQQAEADTALKEYATAHGVVDLDKEAQWYLEQLISTELIYEQAVGEKQAVDLQQANLSNVVAELKAKVSSEEQALESLGTSTGGVGPAQSGAEGTAEIHGRLAIVELKQRELERAQELRARGFISQAQEDQMRAALEAERYAVFNNSPTAGLLKEMLVRELNIKLDTISAERKVSQLAEAVARVKEKLKALPIVQREYIMLKREVEAREAERQRIEQILAGERRKVESETFGFNLVSEAKVPVMPIRSNRRLLAVGVSVAGAMLGLVLVTLLELTDTRVKSTAEAALKLSVPVLATVPSGPAARDVAADQFLTAYQTLRRRWPHPGLALLVTASGRGGESGAVAMELARQIAEHEQHVLVIDSETRRLDPGMASAPVAPVQVKGRFRWLAAAFGRTRRAWERWSRPASAGQASFGCGCLTTPRAGLRGFLEGDILDWRTLVAVHDECGVSVLHRGGRLTSTQLASSRMADLLRMARREYGCVIVHATAVLPLADAGFLAQYVDACVLEVSSQSATVETARRALQRLEDGPAPVAGVVLTGVDPLYMEQL